MTGVGIVAASDAEARLTTTVVLRTARTSRVVPAGRRKRSGKLGRVLRRSRWRKTFDSRGGPPARKFEFWQGGAAGASGEMLRLTRGRLPCPARFRSGCNGRAVEFSQRLARLRGLPMAEANREGGRSEMIESGGYVAPLAMACGRAAAAEPRARPFSKNTPIWRNFS